MKIKTPSLLATVVLAAILLVNWSWTYFQPDPIIYSKPVNTPITLCGSFSANWNDTTLVATRLLSGLGDLHYPVTTTSTQAQEYFEQGLRLIYAFNHWEAIQSFRKATQLDPECAMAYWGLALGYGPNLNDVNPKDRERLAFESIQKAVTLKTKVSQVEKDFIDALALRYDGQAHDIRDSLNFAYAAAMQLIVKTYPDDAEVQTLCADAIMNTMPWDYWNKDGSAKTPTAEAKLILENALRKFPKHPGAHHLYIHLVEASPSPAQALASAEFLETAMPGAGHIIHMPAHIYIRTGQYARSIDLNLRAAKVDEDYLAYSANQGYYRLALYPHNIDFISFSSYMDGRSNLGIQNAMRLAYKGSMITNTNPVFAQYFNVEPLIAYTRFGKWNDILSLADPDVNLVYSNIVWRFARGMAYTRQNNITQAEFELTKLDSLCKLDTLQSIYFTFNPASDVAKIPVSLLRGEILIKKNKVNEGIASLTEAVKAEDNLRYMEPPDWKIPSRHFLGAALMDAGKFAEAEIVYQQDLKINPENGWSLMGLQQSQFKQGKKSETVATGKRQAKAWKNSDVTITTSRF
jgi:tetratricopeptide (TPR) repeat protein